eukprot:scaffold134707_cov21-Tisochrysis_lutea.AAC.1
MVPLDAPPSESHTPQAAHSSEHVRTPGLVQAFPLQVGTERSYQDESDDEELPHSPLQVGAEQLYQDDGDDEELPHMGLEDWSTPVQARSAAGQAPHASYPQVKSCSSKDREHAIDDPKVDCALYHPAWSAEDLEMLLDGDHLSLIAGSYRAPCLIFEGTNKS